MSDEQRETWLAVFGFWLMARIQVSLKELREMVVKIPEIDQTPWGKELKELWTKEARVEGRVEGRAEELRGQMERLRQQLETFEQMFQAGELPEAAYTRLKDQADAELQDVQAELARLSNGAPSNEPS